MSSQESIVLVGVVDFADEHALGVMAALGVC
jgi:hypothetical protein